MTVEHSADLLSSALKDGRLSFRARGLYGYLLQQPETYKIRQKTLSEGTSEGRDAVIKALKELVDNGYIFYSQRRNEAGYIDKKYEIIHNLEIRSTRDGFSGSPGTGFQATSSSSINTEYNNYEEQRPTGKETPVLPINPSAAGSTQGTLPLPGAPPPPATAPPTWWEAESANFRSNQIQQESFCMSRRVEHSKMAALMDRFLADRVIVSDFKRSSDLWKHFLAWFNLGQAKGFIHRDGTLNDTVSDGQQPEQPQPKPGEIVLTRQEQRTAALIAQLTAERNARNAARAAQGG